LLLVVGMLGAAAVLGSPAISELHVSARDTLDSSSQSSKAFSLLALAERRGLEEAPPVTVLVRLPASTGRAGGKARVRRATSILTAQPGMGSILTTYSRDGNWALLAGFPQGVGDPTKRLQKVADLRTRLHRLDGVLVGGRDAVLSELGGQVEDDIRSGELIGLPLLLAVLIWVFRGFALAVLPLVGGAISFFGALLIVRLLHFAGLEFPLLAIVPLVGVSLGLSVDYALLLIARYRDEYGRFRSAGPALRAARRAVSPTIATSAVAIALGLAPLTLMPIPFFDAIGIATGICALFAGAAALFVTPLLLGVYGERIGRTAGRISLFGPREYRPSRFWTAVPAFGMRRPKITIGVVAALLLVMAAPIGSMEAGGVSSAQISGDSESQRAYEVMQERFPPELSRERYEIFSRAPQDRREAAELAAAVAGVRGVDEVGAPRYIVGAWNVEALGKGAVGSPESQATAERLRSLDVDLYVASPAGAIVDRDRAIERRFPIVVLLGGLVLFALAFGLLRSLVVPAKLVLLTLATIASTLGVMVVLFQWLLDEGAFDVSQCVLLVAVILPLIMDYGLFVASRIAEAHRRGETDVVAISSGLAATGPVVSAAGAVFCVAVGAFAFSQITLIRQLSVGLVIAVVIDTTLIRALLVPATMTVFGRWNWWVPGFEDRGSRSKEEPAEREERSNRKWADEAPRL
jgi:putative drug exporter of the RND superfamily